MAYFLLRDYNTLPKKNYIGALGYIIHIHTHTKLGPLIVGSPPIDPTRQAKSFAGKTVDLQSGGPPLE